MALRAAERGKLPATRDGLAKSSSAGRAAPVAARAIPLKLAPLLQPYRKEGRLSLRIEHMQQLARLTRGRNNGDGSWSLASDELDELEYLSPEGMVDAQSLSIRIIGLDQDGTTLAILQVPLQFGEKSPNAITEDAARAAAREQEALIQRQRGELEALKTLLNERDAELVEARREAERTDTKLSRDKLAAELSAARESWKRETERQLAENAVQAGTVLKQAQASWQAERAALAAAAEKRGVELLAESQDHSRRQTKDDLARAETSWRVAEAKRLAKAEADWREKSASALAETVARCERAEKALADARSKPTVRMSLDEVENRRLRQEMGTLRTILAERDAALAQARLIAEQELETVRRGQEAALSSAMSAWKDAEAARLAAAETSWRKRSDASLAEAAGRRDRAEAALAEMRAQFEAAVKSVGDDVEHHLRGELATLRANLCERDVAIAQARTCAEQSAVSVAEMSARCERAEAEASRAQAEAAESSTRQECETRRLHAELSSALAVLADRDASLEQTRLTAERALQRAQRESDAALAKAQSRWKADENARFAATEAQWRKQSASALAEATARYKEAETALAQIRVKSADQGESETVARMRHEIEMLRSALANHDDQLLRAAPAHERRDTPPSRIAIRETHDWESAEPREQKSPTSRRLIRDVIVVAVLAASAIIFWPRLESYIPAGWFPGAAESEPVPNSQATATTATLSPPQPMAMVIRSANVHADPAKTAAVITTLQHGMQIEVIGGRNNWTLVRINGKGGKPQQGWVYSSFLKVLGDKSLPAAKQ